MNNEETRILNPQQNEEPKQNEVKAPESTNKGGFGKKAAAATGIAVGAAATAAAEHAYAHLNGEYVSPEAEEAQDEAQPEVEATAQQEPAPEPVPEPTPEEPATDEIPQDANLVDDKQNNELPEPEQTPDDEGEVHVVSVGTIEDGDGNEMVAAVLENEAGDPALIVDVDVDGTMDVLVWDENQNGYIEEAEVHNLHEEGIDIQTADVIAACEPQPEMQEAPDTYMAEVEAPVDDSMDGPDYMSDADTGLYDA